MSVSAPQADPFVLLYGIPWEQYERITDALGRYHLRHTYVEGTLEMRGLLYGVEWEDYLKFLDALEDYPLRHTYDGGTLEMMSPRKDHDWRKTLLARMIETMTLDLGIQIQSIGSTTLIGDEAERGVQPDEAYYIAHEAQVRGKLSYDPATDPPPDLLIEVDVTNTSVPRLPVYAALKVPEVWRHDGNSLGFFRRLRSGRYERIDHSLAFPFLIPDDVNEFLNQWTTTDENSIIRGFVAKTRKLAQKHKSTL